MLKIASSLISKVLPRSILPIYSAHAFSSVPDPKETSKQADKGTQAQKPPQENTPNKPAEKSVEKPAEKLEMVSKADLIKSMLEVDTKAKEIKELQAKLEQTHVDLKYSYAEISNVSKRYKAEIDSTREYAMTKFAKDVLEIKDNLEKSLDAVKLEDVEKMDIAAIKECFKTFHSGIVMTGQVMESVLKRFGIVKYNPMNEKFDPNMHEAFLKVEDQTKPENTVCTVMQTGYKINKRILRAPKVAVTKKSKS